MEQGECQGEWMPTRVRSDKGGRAREGPLRKEGTRGEQRLRSQKKNCFEKDHCVKCS